LNPYLSFRNTAREAMEFYHSVFGGDLTVSTFGDFGASDDPAERDLVMHSALTTGTGLVLMASDTPARMTYTPGNDVSLALGGSADDSDELRRYFDGLSEGGTVTMPLEVAQWGDYFGMLTDRYGVSWMVSIAAAAS
jgi:PhnB protein